MTTPESPQARRSAFSRELLPPLLIGSSLLYWGFQVVWFWRYCGHDINADAVSYIGIARHVADGNFHASLHGYWSPLISWLIAAASFAGSDYTLIARILMLPSFALCLFLLYRLTQTLWNSSLLSSAAVLWFVTSRGIAAFSISFIGADLLLTAAVLFYFILLLGCLQEPNQRTKWFMLGVAHGVAFLAKAIAMPLFALATFTAVFLTLRSTPKKAAQAVMIAAIFPALVWVGWGAALRAKYGKFTTGYQLTWNLLDPEVRNASRSQALIALHDMRSTYDAYMVTDAMPPGSTAWHARIWSPTLLRRIARKETENIPAACKQLLVLLTPGGLLAFLVCVVQVSRHRRVLGVHWPYLLIGLLTTVAMLLAYCMLVFDGRYVIPVTPVLIALSIRYAFPNWKSKEAPSPEAREAADTSNWQIAAGILLALGLIGSQVYWASPFRTIRQDFQQSVYAAATELRIVQASNIVVIGSGPYPEHGVGWEAGVYAAYFAQAKIVAELSELPPGLEPDSVIADVRSVDPDAILVWGTPADSGYLSLLGKFRAAYPDAKIAHVEDPVKSEVGTVMVLKNKI
jgi:hypothetical protein